VGSPTDLMSLVPPSANLNGRQQAAMDAWERLQSNPEFQSSGFGRFIGGMDQMNDLIRGALPEGVGGSSGNPILNLIMSRGRNRPPFDPRQGGNTPGGGSKNPGGGGPPGGGNPPPGQGPGALPANAGRIPMNMGAALGATLPLAGHVPQPNFTTMAPAYDGNFWQTHRPFEPVTRWPGYTNRTPPPNVGSSRGGRDDDDDKD